MKKKMQTGGIAGNKMMPMASMPQMAKKGAEIKKAKNGTSLGMKSVKSGYDKNPGVTRADFVSIGKKKAGKAMYGKTMKAKSGTKVSKMMSGGKCRSGC